jgi:hypothetical protein
MKTIKIDRYVVVSDLPEFTVRDRIKNVDLFPTKSGNRNYACSFCDEPTAKQIADALNFKTPKEESDEVPMTEKEMLLQDVKTLCNIIVNCPFQDLTKEKYQEIESMALDIGHYPDILIEHRMIQEDNNSSPVSEEEWIGYLKQRAKEGAIEFKEMLK